MAILNLGNSNSAFSGSFSGSFEGDGTNLNLAGNTTIPAGATPTLDAVTTAGSTTTNNITAGIISGSVFNLNNKSAVGFTTTNLNIGYHNDWTQINLGKQSTDEIRVNGILNAQQLVQAKQGMEVTGSLIVSSSVVDFTETTAISGSTFSGSFVGNGNNITNISPSNIGYGNNIEIGTNSNVTDTYGIAIGRNATSAGQAVAIGGFSSATFGAISLGQSTNGGNYTVAVGMDAGHASGQYNVLLGYQAGKNSSGNNNIALGHHAGLNQTSGTGNITIGSGSRGLAGESNQLRIGHADVIAISGSLSTGDIIFYNTASAPNFSGSFQGDGTNLNLASNTTIPAQNPFPLTASSAAIISRSFASGDTDSTALRLFGSGSVSESGIFEVEGSAGPLFSVADGLDGILMEVNNISGLPLFQVSSSNEVFVNRGNLTSGVTTATASFAYFTGSFQGDGSGLTGLPAASAGSTSGRVVFTTTNGALTTDSGFDYDSTTNQLTVENLNVTHLTSSFITSSTIETSGSNIFGDDTTDTQTLIGTTIMTGSAEITGSLKITGSAQEIVFAGGTSTNYPKIDFPDSINIGNGTTMHTSSLGDVVIGQNASTEYGSTYLNTQRRVAIGLNADVNGAGSVAIGHGATVGSTEGIAIGYGAATTAYRATAVGYGASAASSGVAIGKSASTTGPSSIAINGTQTSATGYSVAIGGTASTTGVSVGVSSSAGTNAVGVGQDADATGTGAIAIGTKAAASGQYSIALVGRQYGGGQITNSSGSSFAIYHNDSTPSFFLHQNNKSFYNSTGNFGFNTMNPTATLTVSGSTDITGSFKVTGSADFSNATVTGITVSTSTLDEVTSAGNVTSNAITAGTISGSAFKLNNANALSHTGNILYVGNANDWTTIELGRETTDEIHVNGLLKAEQLLRAEQSAHVTGSLVVTGSAEFRGNRGYATNVVIGQNAQAASQNSVAIGNGAGTSFGGSNNTAIGDSATLNNNTHFGTTVGKSSTVTGTAGIAYGYFATAAGEGIAIGRSANAATYGLAIGKSVTAASSQLAIGYENTTISASFTTGHVILSGSEGGLELIGSGSTMFEVIGSEGTLFSVDDDLDGTIFTANDRSGLPVLEASASGEVYIGKAPQSLYTTAVISSNNANVTQSIYGLDTSSYGGAFFEYTAHSGSNARAGNIMSVWNGSNINFTETTTTDIGSTSDLVMKVHISQSQAQLAAFSTNAGYNIKTIIKSI